MTVLMLYLRWPDTFIPHICYLHPSVYISPLLPLLLPPMLPSVVASTDSGCLPTKGPKQRRQENEAVLERGQ